MKNLPEAKPADLAARLDAYRVVDVREASEFEGPLGHISGAENIPLHALQARAQELAGDGLLVVCRSGKRSAEGCKVLAREGASTTTNLVGGMIAWHQQHLPVVRRPLTDTQAILHALATWLAQVQRLPLPEAEERVRSRLATPAMGAAPDAGLLSCAISRLAEELSLDSDVPADLEIVCATLRGDLAALPGGVPLA
jgi:rhodanese-related sulfurtransferase